MKVDRRQPPPMARKGFSINWNTVTLSAVVGFLVGVGGAIYWMSTEAKSAARAAVLEPDFLEKVSKRIRPLLVIDSKGRITADYGGAEKIEDIEFKFGTNRTTIEVALQLKEHTQSAPVVRSMTAVVYLESFERSKRHGWVYTFRTSMQTADMGELPVGTAAVLDTNYPQTFLIEFLP